MIRKWVGTIEQIKFWEGEFGNEYIQRNSGDFDETYKKTYGITRTELNKEFLGGLDKTTLILEVGCNIGQQLLLLQKNGFHNLWGIEINQKALETAKLNTSLNIVQGSALDMPFKDSLFDLVFTSGVLIHIHPDDLAKAIDEMYRVSKQYIWGFEYFSEKNEEIEYRGFKNKLWKNNFLKLFLERHPDLKVVKQKKIKYLQNNNVDFMYLLEKIGSNPDPEQNQTGKENIKGKTVALIQARMGSTRLPQKVLMDINGKPSLYHIYNRLKHSKFIDQIVVSTSENPKDDPIAEFCKKENIDFFRGSEEDLLDRLYQTAKKFKAKTVIRITGDCPLIDPRIVDKTVEYYNKNDFDFVSNNQTPSYPHGMDTEVFSFEILEKTWENVKDPELRALATFPIYYNHINKVGSIKNEADYSDIRITLDYEEDLELIKEIFKRLQQKKEIFFMEDIIKLLEENPFLNDINKSRKSHHRLKDCEKFIKS